MQQLDRDSNFQPTRVFVNSSFVDLSGNLLDSVGTGTGRGNQQLLFTSP